MIRNNLFLLLLLLLTSSCESQIGTAIGTVFTNIVSGNGFNSSSSDELYRELKHQKITDTNSSISGGINCENTAEAMTLVSEASANLFSKLKDKICTCKAWGTCDKLSCSCEKLCPRSFEILNRENQASLEAPENSLSFNNGDSAFYEQDSNYSGYCWGHALVTQRFNRLATFNSKQPKKFTAEDEDSQRLREYKYIIAKLDNNEPVEISGFKNLKEFSSQPEVKDLLMESVKKNWAQNAMSIQGLSMVTGSNQEDEAYYTKLFDDMEERIKNHQAPVMVFNGVGEATGAHTVLVKNYGVDPKTSERFICIMENKQDADKSNGCQRKMTLTKNGKVEYSFFPRKIGKMKLSYTENSNTVEQINNLKTHCLNSKDCNGEVKKR